MYTDVNFKTKKALKEAVENFREGKGRAVTFFQPNNFRSVDTSKMSGRISVEGPHYPKPHTWYAECDAVDGIIVKVK
jgi:hypothetical protein